MGRLTIFIEIRLEASNGIRSYRMFSIIYLLSIGLLVTLVTVFYYRRKMKYDTNVVLPYETESLHIEEGKDLASLITCHPYRHNSHRLVVYGERIK